MENNRRRNNFWGAIVSAVAAIGTSVAGYVITAKNAVKPEIDSIMEFYVYMQGYSFEAVKNKYNALYNKNKKYFEQQFNWWANKRNQDIIDGVHEIQRQANQKKVLSIILVCISVVLIFLIFRDFKK